jgi:hypothetical protein
MSTKRNYGDNLLLLATKWDELHPPDTTLGTGGHDNFANPDSDVVVEALTRFPFSWARFTRISEVSPDAKALTPYAATWIKNGKRTDESVNKPTFDQFNRTVWNWLYGNALSNRGASSAKDGYGPRKNFYADVATGGKRAGAPLLYRSAMRAVIKLAGL